MIAPIEIFCMAEDQFIRIQCHDGLKATITVRELLQGKQMEVETSCEIAGLVMQLNCAGDEVASKEDYEKLEEVFSKWPNDLRPIP